jgi:hypothetical protein
LSFHNLAFRYEFMANGNQAGAFRQSGHPSPIWRIFKDCNRVKLDSTFSIDRSKTQLTGVIKCE